MILNKLILSFVIVMLWVSQLALAGVHTAEITSACGQSPLGLDCSCVEDTYNLVTQEFTSEEDAATVTMIKSLMAVPGVVQDDQYMTTLMGIMSRVQPLFALTENCKKMGGGADSASDEELEEIGALCRSSDFLMDCDCVDYNYAKAAAGYPKEAQEFVRATIGLRLGVVTNPAYGDISPVVAMQYQDAYMKIQDFRDICAIPSPGGLAAARDIGGTPEPTMEARADASALDAMRMWCEAKDQKSAAFCACQVQTLSEIVPARAFDFTAESMKALAAEKLGRIEVDSSYSVAAQAIGATPGEVEALRNQSAKAFENKFEIANVACEAAIRDLEADAGQP